MSPRRLQPKVPHDLETICLKCLEKDPKNRYESADALAEDLQRYLNDESISARSINVLDRLVRTFDRLVGEGEDYAVALFGRCPQFARR